ncbi:MAG: Hsp33 family molecular chaperone HslO [Myxococcota bacterium]|nr:Hsp33 family molecular chaperone HslO [Myxococcota bacterium]
MHHNCFVRGLTAKFAVRYLLVDSTAIAQVAQDRHKLDTGAATICAEAISASILLASQIKGDERITVQLQTEHPNINFICDISAQGKVRAKLTPTTLNKIPKRLNGAILVIKHNASKELYRGVTMIENKSIAQALQHHLQQSTQIDTFIRISSTFDRNNQISSSIGILLERLPPTPDLPYLDTEQFNEKYDQLLTMEHAALLSSLQEDKLMDSQLHSLETRELEWQCRCSREKVLAVLFSLGPTEIQAMIEEDGKAEVSCHFCNTITQISKQELEGLLADHTNRKQ